MSDRRAERPAISVTGFTVRSYELDSFGHLNHAAYLNHFEHARFQAFEARGFPPHRLIARGEAIHVVRVEVDYRRELKLGQRYEVHTSVHEVRNSSATLRQVSLDEGGAGAPIAEALVTIVWIGRDGRPMRIPDDVRSVMAGEVESDPT